MTFLTIRNGRWSLDMGWIGAVSALLGLIGSIVGGILAVGEWVLMPRLDRHVDARINQNAASIRLELREAIAKIPERAEIEALKSDIQRLNDRVEYLIRLQIEGKR